MTDDEDRLVICPRWDMCVKRECEHRIVHKAGILMSCEDFCLSPVGAHGEKCREATEEELVYHRLLEGRA